MLMRREARELALQIIFQTEFTTRIPYSDFLGLYETEFDKDTISYADFLVKGVEANKEKIDQIIGSASQHWKINRMALVDRNLLRLAIFEAKVSADPVKSNIVINEAIELAKKYGTEDSFGFINGLLDQALNKS